MKYAFVSNSVVDLWAQPRFNSDRLSQILYGDIVSVHEERNGFARVREQDGYTGWLDKRFLVACPKPAIKPPTGWKPAIVATPTAWFDYQKGGTAEPPYFLFYGTRILAGRAARGSISVRLPDGSQRALGERAV
ncbi:MAG: SH3 domain-containing protein, partial [candidate division Zixibacteria bacterium]|nr:SH3 domain-containing protein [candidate division Zixibacteria bacterium]